MVKVLVFTKSVEGGTGTFVLNLLKLTSVSRGKKYRIKICSLEKPRFRADPKFSSLLFFRRKEFYPQQFSLSFPNLIHFYQELLWMKKVTAMSKPKIIISVDTYCNILTILLRMLWCPKIKSVLTIHINPDQMLEEKASTLLTLIIKKSIRFFYQKADALVTVSDNLRKDFSRSFGVSAPFFTISNGISKNESGPVPKRENRIIFSAGRLVKQKDFETILRVFSVASQEIKGIELWIAGEGSMKIELMKLAKKMGIQNRVRFLGWVQDIRKHMKKSSIFVFSSRREGFPYSIIEAMSVGLPVISTDVKYGPREILENGRYGILLPDPNERRFAQCIVELMTNQVKYERYQKMSLKRSKEFSLEAMLQQYDSLLWTFAN